MSINTLERFGLCFLLAITASGCALLRISKPYGPVGRPIKKHITREEPAPFSNAKLGATVVGWASSGGGSRAAYLTAAIFKEVRRSNLRIDLPGEYAASGDLLDQTDFISAVSGGSLSATYFVMNQDQLRAPSSSEAWKKYLDKMALDFRRRQWYWKGMFNPVAWPKFIFTNYNRGQIARDDYNRTLYRGRTISDLPDKPVLYVNSFDVGNRVRFVFTKHYIETSYYEKKDFNFNLEGQHGITSENDLVFTHVDPKSVRLADAVYASSAFPIAYPNMVLNHYGNKIAYQGSFVFLADGGLLDNSGLLTLMTQLRIEVGRSSATRLVLVINIDASIDNLPGGTVMQRQGNESEYAWHNTYLAHGQNAVDAAITHHENTIFDFLKETGVSMGVLDQNYDLSLTREDEQLARSVLVSWLPESGSGKLLLPPLVISLRLQDFQEMYFHNWQQQRMAGANPDNTLLVLFKACGIPSGLEEATKKDWPTVTLQELENRFSNIKTDFVLDNKQRKLLDLVAYLLVHGRLEPALRNWNRVAASTIQSRLQPKATQ